MRSKEVLKNLKKSDGFTLIEVVMVLAIAGLIMVVVFLAVGGAQRANRDTQRVNQAGLIASALESYARNHDGAYPSTALPASYTTAIKDIDTNIAPVYSSAAATATSGAHYANGFVCAASGGSMTATGATVRNYAISYWSEQGAVASCKDNN